MMYADEGERRLAASILILAIKDRDWPWLLSEESSMWWILANYEQPTHIPDNLIIKNQIHLYSRGGLEKK